MKEIRFAVAGCGAIGAVHAEAISSLPGASLAAVFDVRKEAAEAHAARYGCDAFTEYDMLLSRKDVDAVVICTPSGLHSELAVQAARAGKHVVCEKPLDTVRSRAEAMIAACRENGVTLYPILQHRYSPVSAAVKRAIEEGKLGKLFWGSAHVIWYRGGDYYSSGSWRGTAALDGGVLMNQAIHYLDLLQYFLGRPVSVRGKCAGNRRLETEDVGIACLEFEGGVLGSIEATTDAKPGLYSEVSIYGELGSVIIRNHALFYSSVPDAPELDALLDASALYTENRDARVSPEGHLRQYRDIAASIRENRPPMVGAEDALCSLNTVLGIYKASAENKTVFF